MNVRKFGDRHSAPLPRSKLSDPSPGVASVNNSSRVPGAIWPKRCDADISPWQSFNLGTMVNHRRRHIPQSPVRAVYGWRYRPVPASQAVACRRGDRLSRDVSKAALQLRQRGPARTGC
jgi:hypothetical protein